MGATVSLVVKGIYMRPALTVCDGTRKRKLERLEACDNVRREGKLMT